MSLAYDEYLNEHISAVQKGWNWMIDNLIDRIHPWIREQYPNSEFDPIDILEISEQMQEHDASKTRPEEYYAYDAYFYGGNKSHAVVENFRKAFLLHIHENPHHWQYWVLTHDNKGEPETAIEMPLNYIFEMICDWWSFGWRAGDLTTIFKWWDEHKDYIRMHKKSRKVLEYILKEMKDVLTEEKEDDHLEHHGILGQKWGIRRFQNEDGTRTALGKVREREHTVFISGSSKTQSEDSEYYRKDLPQSIRSELNAHMKSGNKIIVGDAPGIDRQVQDYLHQAGYKNVEIYGPGKKVRYSANNEWTTHPIDAPEYEEGSKEWLAKKDIAMTDAADEGLAIILDQGAKATRKNAERLLNANKNVKLFELNKNGADNDHWIDADPREYLELLALEYGEKVVHSDISDEDKKKFGLPDLKKYPMPDPDHVKSAIRFFNYVDPKHEKELAEAILERMKEYNMSFEDFGVGDENRFKNYIPKTDQKDPKDQESK